MKGKLKNKTLYTAQILNSDMTSPNFVSKKVYDEFKSCRNRHELFKKEDIKTAIDGLKKVILSEDNTKEETIIGSQELQSMGIDTRIKRKTFTVMEPKYVIKLIDEAFTDVINHKK